MEGMTEADAILAGGWDPRFAVVRAMMVDGDIAAVVVDPNGDGGSIDLDEYWLDPEGHWLAGNSGGGAGDSASSWSPVMVATYGRAAPGAKVRVGYRGEVYSVTANEGGWWLFATPSLDEDSMSREVVIPDEEPGFRTY